MADQIPVVVVTRNATADPIDDETYLRGLRDLIDNGPDGTGRITFQQLIDLLDSQYSRAWWNLRYRGERPLNRDGKNELRSFLDELPPLPISVAKVVEDLIDPDAEVILVGELSAGEKVKRVLLLAPDGALRLYVNGTVEAEQLLPDEDLDDVTPVTSNDAATSDSASAEKPDRPNYYRPCLPPALKVQIEESGYSVQELVEMGLKAIKDR